MADDALEHTRLWQRMRELCKAMPSVVLSTQQRYPGTPPPPHPPGEYRVVIVDYLDIIVKDRPSTTPSQ